MRIVLVGLLVALLASPGFAQSVASAPLPVSISNVPDVWHADVLSSASVLSLTGADHAVRWLLPTAASSTGGLPKLIRAAELIGLDFPVAIFFVGLDHELGHEFRASELHIPARLRVIGSPWSVHPFLLEPDLAFYPMVGGASLFDLGMESSGLEAVWLFKDRVEARVLRQGRVRFGDAVTLLVAATHTPVYAVSGMGAPRDVGITPQGDIANYVYQLNELRRRAGQPDSGDLRAAVRARCMLNLIDLSLWSDVAGIGTWLARGDESRTQSWLQIGRVGLIPALRYSLTPIGPEFSVRSHVRVGHTRASAYVRWSEPIGNARQKGAGITYLAPGFHGLEPTIQFDAWSHTVSGAGARGEISVATPGWPNRRVAVSATFGVKSSGYLEGYPLARSAYGAVGLNIVLR
jgi:hypothetical protein